MLTYAVTLLSLSLMYISEKYFDYTTDLTAALLQSLLQALTLLEDLTSLFLSLSLDTTDRTAALLEVLTLRLL